MQNNIVIVTDDREDLDVTLKDFDRRVDVLRIPDMKFGNVFHTIKIHSKFGKGTIFVFSGGTLDLLHNSILPDCEIYDCQFPQQILTLPTYNGNHSHLVNKALRLNMDLLDSTTDDVAIFCGLMPIPFEQYYNYVMDNRQCISLHSAKIIPFGEKNNFKNYRIAIKWYNDFTKYHAKALFNDPWDLEQSYFSEPPQTIFAPDYYSICPAEATKRCKLIKSLCTKLLTAKPTSFSSQNVENSIYHEQQFDLRLTLNTSKFGSEYTQQHEERRQSSGTLSKNSLNNLNRFEDDVSFSHGRPMSTSSSDNKRVQTFDQSSYTRCDLTDQFFRFQHSSRDQSVMSPHISTSDRSSRSTHISPSDHYSWYPYSSQSDRSFAFSARLSHISSIDRSSRTTNINPDDYSFRVGNISPINRSSRSLHMSTSDQYYSSRHSPVDRSSRSQRIISPDDQSYKSHRHRSPSYQLYSSRQNSPSYRSYSSKHNSPVYRSSRSRHKSPSYQSYSPPHNSPSYRPSRSRHNSPVDRSSRYWHKSPKDLYSKPQIISPRKKSSRSKNISPSNPSSRTRCISPSYRSFSFQPMHQSDHNSLPEQFSERYLLKEERAPGDRSPSRKRINSDDFSSSRKRINFNNQSPSCDSSTSSLSRDHKRKLDIPSSSFYHLVSSERIVNQDDVDKLRKRVTSSEVMNEELEVMDSSLEESSIERISPETFLPIVWWGSGTSCQGGLLIVPASTCSKLSWTNTSQLTTSSKMMHISHPNGLVSVGSASYGSKPESKETQSETYLPSFNSSASEEPVGSFRKNKGKETLDSQSKLRERLGDHLFEEYSVKLEVARSSFDRKFELYRHLPQMYTNYQEYYNTFSAIYDAQYDNGNQEHKNGLWNIFWLSRYEEIKSEEWQKEHRYFLAKYFEKAAIEPATSSISPLSLFNSLSAKQISNVQDPAVGNKPVPVVSEESLSLIESVCDELSHLGSALRAVIEQCRALGTTNKEAYSVLTKPYNLIILKLALTKLKALHQSSTGDARIVYGRVINWIMFYSKSNIAAISPSTHYNDENKLIANIDKSNLEPSSNENKLSFDIDKIPVDLNALADATEGKGNAETFDIIKTALVYKGILDPPREVIHDIFLKVSSLHFTRSFKT